MNDKWYAVPGYKGKSQRGEIRDPHVLDAAGQLVCVCEGLDIAERIAEDRNTRTTPEESMTAEAIDCVMDAMGFDDDSGWWVCQLTEGDSELVYQAYKALNKDGKRSKGVMQDE